MAGETKKSKRGEVVVPVDELDQPKFLRDIVPYLGGTVKYYRLLRWADEPGFPIFDGMSTVRQVQTWLEAQMTKQKEGLETACAGPQG